jgi:hypothetical protein
MHAHAVREKAMEGGLVGKIFGFATEKPGNVAAFCVIVSFVFLGIVLMWGTDTSSISKKDELTLVAGFISLALGFVFGRTTS